MCKFMNSDTSKCELNDVKCKDCGVLPSEFHKENCPQLPTKTRRELEVKTVKIDEQVEENTKQISKLKKVITKLLTNS